MILPSKVITYKESSLSRFPYILRVLRDKELSPNTLYNEVKGHFSDMEDYLETLDCLYALGKIEINEEKGVLHYVT